MSDPMGPTANCRGKPSDAEIDRAVREFTRGASQAGFRFIRRGARVHARARNVRFLLFPSFRVPFPPLHVTPRDFVAIGPTRICRCRRALSQHLVRGTSARARIHARADKAAGTHRKDVTAAGPASRSACVAGQG
jgi:hypothetical protein